MESSVSKRSSRHQPQRRFDRQYVIWQMMIARTQPDEYVYLVSRSAQWVSAAWDSWDPLTDQPGPMTNPDVAIFSLLFQAYKKATLIMTLVLRSTRLAGTCFPAQTVVFFNSILQPSMLLSLCIIGMFCHSVTRFSATTTTAVIALLSNRWMESVLYCFMPFVITICEVWSVKYIVCVKPDFGVDPTQWHQLRQPAR